MCELVGDPSKKGMIWLCKRYYMSHDVLEDRYGRLFHLPFGLSKVANIQALSLSYRQITEVHLKAHDECLEWRSVSIGILGLGLFSWLYMVFRSALDKQVNVVVASSDCLQIIVGAAAARLAAKPFFADLYDNYESFGLARIPGIKYLYRKALASAAGIVTVSETLAEKMIADYPQKPVLVIESTIDKSVFYRRSYEKSKSSFGLPDRPCIGVCGGLNDHHDIKTVFKAFDIVRSSRPDVILVLAGSKGSLSWPSADDIIYLGMLSHENMPVLYSALDVALIPMADSSFGYYAFPQKAYEILACEVPVVAADVGSLARLFNGYEQCLYQPADAASLAKAILVQLNEPVKVIRHIPDWAEQGDKLYNFISSNVS